MLIFNKCLVGRSHLPKSETTVMGYIRSFWGYRGIMEKKMETTIVPYITLLSILGLSWDYPY